MNGAAKAPARNRATVSSMPGAAEHTESSSFMLEGIAIGMCLCCPDGRIVGANSALASLLRYSTEEVIGLQLSDLRSGSKQEVSYFEQLKNGTRRSLYQEGQYRRKDGSELWGKLTVCLVRDNDGIPTFLLASLEDATEDKRAAEKSLEAEKMEVIGRLAGGIAHDFNNLLTGILLYCDLLSDGLERGNRLRQHVDEIRLAGEQGAALTQQLLAISRKEVAERRPTSLNAVVSSTENLLRRLIGEQIVLVSNLAAKPTMVLADPAQLRQVLLNLVLNARDAMPQGGRITVSTGINHRVNGQAAVALLVEDTGCGMDESTRARLFEPFFTTKLPGHGTGLGLATVKRIVSESGGAIDVTSEPGHGTRIKVLLPTLAEIPAAETAVKARHARKTVLLVDDHSSARNSIQRVLDQAGYCVLPASSGKRAMKIFAERSDEVELLLADRMMPGMSGNDLAHKLLQQKPDLKVLLISGYHEPRQDQAPDSVELIRKPFAGRYLLDRIREVLDPKGESPW
jgi:PAS domain S-box-containing protein